MSKSKAQQLGAFIREQRLANKLSIRDLSKKTGIAVGTIAEFEAGSFASPDPAKLVKIARAVSVPVEDFYALAGYMVPEGLPEFGPYLRTKYALSDADLRQLNQLFKTLSEKKKGGRRGSAR